MFDAKRYLHRHDWTTRSELRQHLHRFLPASSATAPELHLLEIGSYEGLTACFFSDELLDHPDSTLTCVDPFDLSDSTTELLSDTEQRFHTNIARSKNGTKIQHTKMFSQDFFQLLDLTAHPIYDLIYIDGSHVPEDVHHDITQAFPHLKPGGILWMDDYHFGTDGSVKRAMDAALATLPPESYTRIHEGYQLAIRKTKAI